LQISGPHRVEVGEPIIFTLTARGVAAIAGYETAMLFDTSVAQFHQIEQSSSDLKTRFGRDIEPLTAVQVPYGAAIGLISCPVLDCLVRSGLGQTQGGRGTVELARVTIGASQPGTLEVRFDAIKVVTAIGVPLPISIPAQTFNIQVGDPGTGQRYAAPSTPWQLPNKVTGNPRPFDITGSGEVTYADVVEIALEWQTLREHGAPCGNLRNPHLDINRDGCIDVADLQLVASRYSLTAAANRSTMRVESDTPEGTHTLQQASNTYTVNSTGDQPDANIGNGICSTSVGTCTLRAAIQEAVRDTGASTINFNIPGTGVQTIVLTSALPTLWNGSGPTTIDGYTQPGSSPNTDPGVSNAKIMIQIEGAGEDQFRGLTITSPGNVIRGLAWYRFERAFWVYGKDADNNVFTGNFIGTNAAGAYGASTVVVTQAHGMHIEKGADNNRIGGITPAERNVISGSSRTGVSIWHGGSNANVVYNNLFGLRPDGTRCLPNRIHGADMNYGASNNIIGGTSPGQRNVFTGNGFSGVDVSHGTDTTGNRVVGNFIGTNVAGTGTVTNCFNNRYGLRVKDGVKNNIISDNVIGGNREAGIEIQGPPTQGNVAVTTFNTLTRNRIGVSLADTAIANPIGVLVNGQRNVIGPDNIIARNTGAGVQLVEPDSDFNTITRNSIYSNGGLGIDLAPLGVTLNDPDDADSGPNQNLNFPVLESATTGQVTGTACGGCKIEIFIADSAASAYGEGRTFVGSATANADGTFVVPVTGVSGGLIVTSTATDSNGNTSEFSLNVLVSGSVTVPAAPANLTATKVSNSQIDLTWTDGSNDEANFVVERSFDQTNWSVLATLPANTVSYSHTTARVNTSYFYRVKATNSAGSSAPSNVASAATATALPGRIEAEDYREGGTGFGFQDTTSANLGGAYRTDAVDIQTTQDAGGGFNVGWTDAGEWLAYDVTVATSGTYHFTARVASPNTGRTFHIEVDGVNVTGPITVPNSGGFQTWRDVTVGPFTIAAGSHTLKVVMNAAGFNINYVDVSQSSAAAAPAAPGNLMATPASPAQIDLSWADNSDNEESFVVERSLDESTWAILDILPAGAVAASDTTVNPETMYFYRITATNGDGNSEPSNTATATTPAQVSDPPASPSALTATKVSNSQIDLTWTDEADNETNVVVERSFDQTNWSVLATLPADSSSHSDSSVRVNTTYFYRVVATNSAGSSAPSDPASATTATALPGRIEIEDYREGGANFGHFDTTAGNIGGAYRNDDVDIQTTGDTAGTHNVGWIDAGEWLAYDVIADTDGNYTFTARVASPNSGKTFRIEIDGTNLTGSIAVPNTGGWQKWANVTVGPFPITAGSHTLRIVMETNGFNLNYLDVSIAP
nr:carbohydrate-binding protein [Chloroflexia bacterium]